MYHYEATVVRVVDGDTIDLKVDLGFRCNFTDRFRLANIDAPERGQTGWSESKTALEGMLPVGSKIHIVTEHPRMRDPRDGFGRWIATLFVDSEATSVNDQMVGLGYAKIYGA